MQGFPTSFWGKLRQDSNGAVSEWHPLIDHCADVASVTEALLGLPLWRARIARVAGQDDLDSITRARLCVFSALHDLGKFTTSFQSIGRPDLGVARGGHVGPGIGALLDPTITEHLEPLGEFGDAAFGLLVAAIAHHGAPQSCVTTAAAHQRTPWNPLGDLDPRRGLASLVKACQRWFPAAFEPGNPLPESSRLQHAFAGLVMLADWIASNTAFFPYSEGDGDRMAFARACVRHVPAEMSLDVPPGERHDGFGRTPFTRVSGFAPLPAQQVIADLPAAPDGSITVLESETGSGKTEAALAHFVRLFDKGEVDGLYFALPTRSAATQIYQRATEAAKRAFASPPPVVLAVPGYIDVDGVEGQRLANFEFLWPDSERFRYRGWAAERPKRYLAGAVVVGTIDQVLLSSLMVRHSHLRATALLRHLLVIDEVHASDDYMTRILEDVLARHARAGGHALLLSATLAAEARHRLLTAGTPEGRALPTIDESRRAPYPLVSRRSVAPGSPIEHLPVRSGVPDREIHLSASTWLEDAAAIANRALDAARAGAKVLVLRNTVADCIATQLAVELAAAETSGVLLRCNGIVAPHHGRFARDDRIALDSALERAVGKVRSAGGRVVVATQTVQQSLDIDVDLLITDLCPIDVLLQRVGRLHRHVRARPPGFEMPTAIILVPSNRDLALLVGQDGRPRPHHGIGSVYRDLRVLEATWRCLEREPVWFIPAMSRELVERCLHSSALDEIVRERGTPFVQHRMHLLGERRGHTRLAELNVVDWNKPYSETSFPNALDERVQTRLGEGDRIVSFSPAIRSPFGCTVPELSIRASLTRGAGPEALVEDVVCTAYATRFRFGHGRYIYDRLGLRQDEDDSGTREEKRDDDGP